MDSIIAGALVLGGVYMVARGFYLTWQRDAVDIQRGPV